MLTNIIVVLIVNIYIIEPLYLIPKTYMMIYDKHIHQSWKQNKDLKFKLRRWRTAIWMSARCLKELKNKIGIFCLFPQKIPNCTPANPGFQVKN